MNDAPHHKEPTMGSGPDLSYWWFRVGEGWGGGRESIPITKL